MVILIETPIPYQVKNAMVKDGTSGKLNQVPWKCSFSIYQWQWVCPLLSKIAPRSPKIHQRRRLVNKDCHRSNKGGGNLTINNL